MVIDNIELVRDESGTDCLNVTRMEFEHYGWFVKVWIGNLVWEGHFMFRDSAENAIQNLLKGRGDLSQFNQVKGERI